MCCNMDCYVQWFQQIDDAVCKVCKAMHCMTDSHEYRYQQIGNAVSPCVASALGRCLALAATREIAPEGTGMLGDLNHAVVAVPDPAVVKVLCC